jgi:hypothetical protein
MSWNYTTLGKKIKIKRFQKFPNLFVKNKYWGPTIQEWFEIIVIIIIIIIIILLLLVWHALMKSHNLPTLMT